MSGIVELIAELRRHERDYPSLIHGPLCGRAADALEQNSRQVEEHRMALEAQRQAMEHACDLLAERRYGSPARSPGHNARLHLEGLIKALPLPVTSTNGCEP